MIQLCSIFTTSNQRPKKPRCRDWWIAPSIKLSFCWRFENAWCFAQTATENITIEKNLIEHKWFVSLKLVSVVIESWSRKSAQDDKLNFCLTAGTLWPTNQERPCRDDCAGTTHRPSGRRWRLPPSSCRPHPPKIACFGVCLPQHGGMSVPMFSVGFC